MNDATTRVIKEMAKKEVQKTVKGVPGKDTNISSPKVNENYKKAEDDSYTAGFIKRAIEYGLTDKQACELLLKLGYIHQENGKYYVHSEKGKRLSKGYDSHEAATHRLQQIEYFKNKSKL